MNYCPPWTGKKVAEVQLDVQGHLAVQIVRLIARILPTVVVVVEVASGHPAVQIAPTTQLILVVLLVLQAARRGAGRDVIIVVQILVHRGVMVNVTYLAEVPAPISVGGVVVQDATELAICNVTGHVITLVLVVVRLRVLIVQDKTYDN